MKTHLAIALLVPLALLPFGAAHGTEVTFSLTAGHHLAPSYKTCTVHISPGANGADVLDAAAAQGCISGWQSGFGGAYVTCIDGICGQPGTFWAFYVDEQLPEDCNAGILDPQFWGGENVEFTYADWFTPFLEC